MKTNKKELVSAIDAILPQTQCGLCDYPGCKPYAEAIVNQDESIDRCLPGGIKTLQKLGEILKIDSNPYLEQMREKAKPPMTAIIRESECIGCTKCLQACPVDAIIGSSKQMHTIITDACTGCELCIPPCPVDCIDMMVIQERNESQQQAFSNQARDRYEKRNQRLSRDYQKKRAEYLKAKFSSSKKNTLEERKNVIAEAIARVKSKKVKANE